MEKEEDHTPNIVSEDMSMESDKFDGYIIRII